MIHDQTKPCRPARRSVMLALVLAGAWPCAALAQQQQQPPPAPPPAAVPAQPQFQQSPEWGNLPKMQLERQFAGPLQDTVIQRLRDPVDGTVCYLYLPISVLHSPTTASGFVQYGPNTIGSINCVQVPSTGRAAAPGRK